jgi:oxygen-independent coproporphyrinogen-3 oxidase
LHALLALEPSHISCYALTIEEGTRLAHDIGRELVVKPDEARQIDMESVAESLLTSSGFVRYEISNYAKPGWACRHNLLYWTDQDYLGLGPSAQSYVTGVRFGDIADLTAYMEELGRDTLPIIERTKLSIAQQQRDALIFGLRLVDGVSGNAVTESLSTPAARTALEQLLAKGLIEIYADRLKLTRLGLRYADTVAEQLF